MATELITNGTFDTDVSGWGGLIAHESGPIGGRSNIAKVEADGPNFKFAQEASVALTGGVLHTLSFQYYIPSANTTCTHIRPREGTSTYVYIDSGQGGLDSWTPYSVDFTPAASNDWIAIYMAIGDSVAGMTIGDKIYFDDVSCQITAVTYVPKVIMIT